MYTSNRPPSAFMVSCCEGCVKAVACADHIENEMNTTPHTHYMWLALQAQQRLSVAVHIASAWEIATEMQLAGGGGEAPSSDEEGAATA